MILNKLLSIEYVASLHINTGALQLFIMTVWINILLAVVWSRYFSQLMIQWNVSAFVANSSYTCLLCGCSFAGDVPVPTHSEGHSFWDTRPRQSSSAHTLGADGLRCPVHIFTQIPHHLTNCSVSMFAAHDEKSSAALDSLQFLFHYDANIGRLPGMGLFFFLPDVLKLLGIFWTSLKNIWKQLEANRHSFHSQNLLC